ncbi:MAG: histidine--tRNA ligase [Clostridiales bacterium]
MTLTKTPVKGMKDILPEEMAIRDYAIGLIKETYKTFGFTPIETPCMEHIGNLTSKQGGENESLIFKIMKRGEKLSLEQAASPDDLVDNGLRYDLTVSLCRFYANNLDKLPNPFKALQIGSVWRADRPQKGRFRQFTQCDIDILGESSMLAEIELITATTTLLGKLGFQDFTLRLNHRQLLKAMAAYSGFPEDSSEKVFIILDKMDKIGLEGVSGELLAAGFPQAAVDTYLEFFQPREGKSLLEVCSEKLAAKGDAGAMAAIGDLNMIMSCVDATKDKEGQGNFHLVFDPTLVRGMGYYTGPIFEIAMKEFGSSVGGGGRYDQLVGNFTNLQVPACGLSIGFERIISILLDQGFSVPSTGKKIAFLAEKGLAGDELCAMLLEAGRERRGGSTVLVTAKNKNSKFQREQLEKEGYSEFRNFHKKS